MIEGLLPLVLLVELALCVASWHRLQASDMGVAEALARAIALTLASLGLAVQVLFLLHLANIPWLLDAALLAFAVFTRRRGRRRFLSDLRAAATACRDRPCAWLLAAALAGLACLVWAVPPANWDSMTYNLARVLVMMRENTLAPEHVSTFRQISFSPGFDLLHYFFLRYGVDRGVGVFSWLAYLLILIGTFVLARRFGDAPFALRVTLVVASLKLLVLEASSTKNDIGATGLAVACLVGAAGFLDRPSLRELPFLLTCAFYGLSTKSYFAMFAGPFLALVLWAHRRALASDAMRTLRTSPWRLAAATGALLVVLGLGLSSQWINLVRFGDPFGPPQAVALHKNADGVVGAAANLFRYALQSLDAPGKWWFFFRRDLHVDLLGAERGPGASMAFHWHYAPGNQLREDSAWFGLLGGLLVAPCIVLGLFRRDGLTRILAATLCLFLLAVCANITWFTYNNRFLSLFFGASGLCLAASRGLWHDRIVLRRLVLTVAGLTLAAGVCLNQDRPLVDAGWLPTTDPPLETSIFNRPGGRRGVYDNHFGGPLLLDFLSRGMRPDRQALLIAGPDSWVYPVLFYGRHKWLVMGEDTPMARVAGESFDIRDCGSLRRGVGHFELVVVMEEDKARSCLEAGKAIMTTRATWGEVLVFSPGKDAAGP
jgi:hypothetical protein